MPLAKDTIWSMRPDKAMARQLAVRDVPALVCDAVNLEGVPMTLPEVQTILDGITVGGHKIGDQNMVIHQADTWRRLFSLVDRGEFYFSKPVALALHAIAGKEEALEWGAFRTGNVTIRGSDYEPPGPRMLDGAWSKMESEIDGIGDIYDRAITAFLRMARARFFWDVNKRMGRFMMNGILLSEGYPVINVPARRQEEFNRLMLDFYSSDDMSAMNEFLRGCLHSKIIENFQSARRSRNRNHGTRNSQNRAFRDRAF